MKRFCSIAIVLFILAAAHAEPLVKDTQAYRMAGSASRILRGSIDLPSEGVWISDTNCTVNLLVPDAVVTRAPGRRMGEVLFRQNINRGRIILYGLNWRCREYARLHEGRGPSTPDDLGTDVHPYPSSAMDDVPWSNLPDSVDASGPFCYLVPNARYAFEQDRRVVHRENREVLAFELRPYVDDGKHWVCYTDGSVERVEIDPQLLQQTGQTIRPMFDEAPQHEKQPATYAYAILTAVPDDHAPSLVPVSLRNTHTGKALQLSWDISTAQAGDESVLQQYRECMLIRWWPYVQASEAPVLRVWMAIAGRSGESMLARVWRDLELGRGRVMTSFFGVMGGFAAVRETLQMQLLTDAPADDEQKSVSLDSIERMQVESHPYEQMLSGRDGGRLELAELVPHDRFMVYLARPETLVPMLDSGAGFLSQVGATATGSGITYDLPSRYLSRLGVSEPWLRRFLESGGVRECVIMLPDLFVIDGTELTVISRMSNPEIVIPLLRTIGLPALSDQEITELKNVDGRSVYWALREDLLLVSTCREELQLSLELHTNEGAGSLGRSAEFRYMLTQLPVGDQTRAYVYFSDPFIRRLISPEVKIAQLRRVQAMNRLRILSAAALLARMEGFNGAPSLDLLLEHGYLPDSFDTDDCAFARDVIARSEAFGTLADPVPVGRVNIESVSESEARAYRSYVRNYTAFWRQFFDPIALRIDDQNDGSLEAGIFILPLIDSSIYEGIRNFIFALEDGRPMKVPVLAEDPVLRFSMNLKEAAWQSFVENLSGMFNELLPILDTSILDDLGTSLHLFVLDGDPIIASGSGDVFGIFGSRMIGRNSEMVSIPLIVSLLTRPSLIAVETANQEKTVRLLRSAATAGSRQNDPFNAALYQIEDRDAWVCMIDIMGVVRLRYGLEVKEGFLLIKNLPWSNSEDIETVQSADLNGMGLQVWPAACRLQLPGLYCSLQELEQAASFQGMGLIYPLVASGEASLEEAFNRNLEIFGNTPRVASGDSWSWQNGILQSRLYGSVINNRQPAYHGEEGFGLLGGISNLELQMQFEETGLRTTIRWKTR